MLEQICQQGSGPAIAKHVDKFVDGNADRIVGMNVLGETEAGRIGGIFWFERAEEFVPDDERAAVVAVDVFGIGAVLDAMMGGRVEDGFKQTDGADEFGVNPELVKKTDGLHRHDHGRWETDDGHP